MALSDDLVPPASATLPTARTAVPETSGSISESHSTNADAGDNSLRNPASTLQLAPRDLELLQQSAHLLTDPAAMRTAAEYIYGEFAELPGSDKFLYDLPTRIASTAGLLDFLVTQFSALDVAPRRITDIFAAIGAAHARAGMPMALLGEGPQVFARCLARVASDRGGEWLQDYSAAWQRLMEEGVEIQKRAYHSA